MYKNIYIPIGVAGCGKTTYFDTKIKDTGNSIRISPDDIRFKILNSEITKVYFDQTIEDTVWKEAYDQFEKALINDNYDTIYFDATNLTLVSRYQLISRALKHSDQTCIIQVNMIWFDLSLAKILIQNKKRVRVVPDKVIAEQFVKLQPPMEFEYDFLEKIDGNIPIF